MHVFKNVGGKVHMAYNTKGKVQLTLFFIFFQSNFVGNHFIYGEIVKK